MYNIAAKPTLYSGVQFRSRLEARWAAFFDMCRWRWDYEPIDLQGWVPDFLIHTPHCKVLVEVKPVDIDQKETDPSFGKAKAHWQHSQILLLGFGLKEDACALGIGTLLDPPKGSEYEWPDLNEFFCRADVEDIWRAAGNEVQYLSSH